MPIIIYTYRDPYKLTEEPFFSEISSCPYFCASQTLVNGLRSLFPQAYPKTRVTTIQNLTESIFDNWESTASIVKQHADIDNILSAGIPGAVPSELHENLSQSFRFNRGEVFASLRTMFELDLKVQDVQEDALTPEQKVILEIYKKILNSDMEKDFRLSWDGDEAEIDLAIVKALCKTGGSDEGTDTARSMDMERLVIHGVHQFTPLMLRAIECVSKFKKVILLFNYQTQYKYVYQTWIDIYNAFDSPIHTSVGTEFQPCMDFPTSYAGNLLGDRLGKLYNGQVGDAILDTTFDVLEFDNMTEFAGYVSDVFEAAAKEKPDNPMSAMHEQIYAADSSVNDILKIYFPEQFGERQFLDYPLGHFFLAIANMWDPVENKIMITDPNDMKECLQAGILKERFLGELASIYGKISALFEGCTSIEQMQSRLKKLKKNRRHLSDPELKEALSHISYYSIPVEDIERIQHALEDLQEISSYFYEDFEKESHNFRSFYRRLKKYLQEEVLEDHELGEEFTDIIRRVLARIEEVEDIDTSASFDCLKATMSVYLVQETKPGKSANWIVRNFEQIDGDILRSGKSKNGQVIYHFACLTDEDINASKIREFPWPLDSSFFEIAQEPVDWKAQVYVKSRKEYKNYKAYALLYGLEFNRTHFKLSYVRRSGDKDRNIYYMLSLLGANIISYEKVRSNKFLGDTSHIQLEGEGDQEFNVFDYCRFKICRYRFLLESLVEGDTVYKDTFLLAKYLEVMLENQIKTEMQGLPVSEMVLVSKLDDVFDELQRYFPFVENVGRMDIVNNIRNRILGNKQVKFPILSANERKYMMLRELFIHIKLSDPKHFRNNILADKFPDVSDDEIAERLSSDKLKTQFICTPDLWCQYCSNKDLCTAFYTI